MLHVPVPAPMAALRVLRRAAHWPAVFDDVSNCTDALVEPLAQLLSAWSVLRLAVCCYQGERTTRTSANLQSALVAFDEALAVFHGPSGWEQPAPT